MEKQTDLANTVEDTNLEAQYDEACKRLLGNKEILAWILKTVVKEFKDCEVKEIAGRYIEGTPEIASVPVNPGGGETNAGIPRRSEGEAHSRVAGMNNEDSVYREGRIFYDIRFQAVYPKLGKLIRIYINVEAQKDFYPGYPIPKRGIFYCSRMISAQYHTEFEEPDYDEIKKVYSIWLCLNPSEKAGNTIARYAMGKEDLVGESDEQPENYDLLSVVQICLGGEKQENYSGVIRLLGELFSEQKPAAEKKAMLEEEFQIAMSVEVEKEVDVMCNLSQGILERGFEKGEKKGEKKGESRMVFKLIDTLKGLGLTDVQIRQQLRRQEISEEYLEQFNQVHQVQ